MSEHEQKLEIFKKYIRQMKEGVNEYHLAGASKISGNKLDKFLSHFNGKVEPDSILGFYDVSFLSNCKTGYLFTDEKLYYFESMEKPAKIWYEDIKSMKIYDKQKKDRDRTLLITMNDGKEYKFFYCNLCKTPFYNFLNEMRKFSASQATVASSNPGYQRMNNTAADITGLGVGAYGQAQKSFDEERFHARQGHGFAAERANDAYDKLHGRKAEIVGDDNAANGPDRLVNGVYIQSKYCSTGKACIDNCFDEHGFRYMMNGKPMQIEVPSDKYDEAVRSMADRIRSGQVPGVKDPNEAENIVRKGNFTYQQAVNIAKAGTVESIVYDAAHGTVIATSAFGVTSMITFATQLWNGEDVDVAMKTATLAGLRIGGVTFVVSILSSQLSKAGLNSLLVGSTEALFAQLGPKASAFIANAFRTGRPIYGPAAQKAAAKLLRGNLITSTLTVVVLSSADIINIFRGRISGAQLFKNLVNTGSTVAGGAGGGMAGAAIGTAILPGVGTAVGGFIGALFGGSKAGKASDAIMSNFIEDDANKMLDIIQKEFTKLASEYLLSQKEAEKITDRLSSVLDGKELKDMFASSDQHKYARNLLIPLIKNQVTKRAYIKTPDQSLMVRYLTNILNDIAVNA